MFEELSDWGELPEGCDFQEVADVAVDSGNRVYVFNRGVHPIIVFEADGTFVAAWGRGMFIRPHGLTLGPEKTLYCVDAGAHCVHEWTLDGQLLRTIGAPDEPALRHSGEPFNGPTKVAVDRRSGDLYISDGYGNVRLHKYSSDGRHLLSWGAYGTDPGQFNLPHSVATDAEGRVYVADRENHRIQVFDERGTYLEQWNNLHRPCGLHIEGERAYVGQLPTHLSVNADYPNLGACVSVHDLTGRRLCRLGDEHPGEKPGQFTAPHGLAVDSLGDLYVGEVSWTAYGRTLTPPRTTRCLRKLVKDG